MTVTEHSRHPTASMVVIDRATQAVLLVHHKAMDLWVFPGGHLEANETLAECALREVHEETGVEAAVFSEFGFTLPGMEWHPSPWITATTPAPAKPHRGEPAHTHIDHLFIGTADSTLPVAAQLAEVNRVIWLAPGTTHDLSLRSEVPLVTRAAVQRLRYAGAL